MNTDRKPGRVQEFAVTSLFAAIIFLMAFTPIGFIQLGLIKATIIHVPVIIASVVLGPRIGALLGGLFGLASLINNTVTPALLSFAFSPLIPVPGLGRGSILALLICFGPRILVGITPYYTDLLVRKWRQEDRRWRIISLFAAGIVGSLTNTLLVMNLIYLVFGDAYASIKNVGVEHVYKFVLSVIFIHGVPEALVAGVFTSAICKAVILYRKKENPSA